MRRRTRTAPPPGLPPGATPATYPVTSASQALELPVDLYTMDLRGSDAIWVIETPPDQPLTPARNTVIADAAGVAGIVDTLAKLPRRGPILKKLGPTVVIRLVGVSGGTARGYVELYDGQLKTESTGFYRAGDLEATRLERELHDQATRALATSPAP